MKQAHVQPPHAPQRGFTLVEMIGVLAIIAILSALLIPRVFTAINESRVSGAAMSYNSAKSAALSYFGKYGRFGDMNGNSLDIGTQANIATNWDSQVLLRSGFTERPFETKIATRSRLALASCASAATAPTGANSAYDLSGLASGSNEAAGGRYVLEAILEGVALEDARDLNKRIDGESAALGEGGTGGSAGVDASGRVKYNHGSAATGTVRIYVAHR